MKVNEEEDDLNPSEREVQRIAAEVNGQGAGRNQRGCADPYANLGEPDCANAEDFASHHGFWADGCEHDLEDARGFLFDDRARYVHSVKHDDQIHDEEEHRNADLG
jgi:hypothetical protein